MNNRTFNILGLIVLSVVGLLFLINLRQYLFADKQEGFLIQDRINGMAVLHKKKLYTLSFDQQKEVVRLLNQSLPVKGVGSDQSKEEPDFDKIVIYLFDADPINVTPLAWTDRSSCLFGSSLAGGWIL